VSGRGWTRDEAIGIVRMAAESCGGDAVTALEVLLSELSQLNVQLTAVHEYANQKLENSRTLSRLLKLEQERAAAVRAQLLALTTSS
jgi:hypothetical protein